MYTHPDIIMICCLQDYPFEDEAARRLLTEQGRFVVTEHEPAFDAADIARCGKDIFVQLSQVRWNVSWGILTLQHIA